MLKCLLKIALGPDVSVELVAHNLAVSYHMIFLSVCVGGLATDATLYILIATDFIINNYFAVMTWRAKKNITEKSLQKLKKSVQILVLAESLEIIIPLAYLLCFVIAYYGPNADILGNIKNGYWQYQEISCNLKPKYKWFAVKNMNMPSIKHQKCYTPKMTKNIDLLLRGTLGFINFINFNLYAISLSKNSKQRICI